MEKLAGACLTTVVREEVFHGRDGLRAVRLIISAPNNKETRRKMGRHRGHPSLFYDRFGVVVVQANRITRIRAGSSTDIVPRVVYQGSPALSSCSGWGEPDNKKTTKFGLDCKMIVRKGVICSTRARSFASRSVPLVQFWLGGSLRIIC
jgi:hypothetical protein